MTDALDILLTVRIVWGTDEWEVTMVNFIEHTFAKKRRGIDAPGMYIFI